MKRNNGQGYSRERLINALSILGEMKQMLEIMYRVSGSELAESQTDESQKIVLYFYSISANAIKICSREISHIRAKLDELIALEKMWEKPIS
jgi:peroxiredoxin